MITEMPGDVDDGSSDTATPPAAINSLRGMRPVQASKEDPEGFLTARGEDCPRGFLSARGEDFFPAVEGSLAGRNHSRDARLEVDSLELHDIQVKPKSTATPSSSSSSQVGYQVFIHVYEMSAVSKGLNELILERANLGAFHVGVEVLDNEWSFQGFHDAWDDPDLSGVVRNEPRLNPGYIYRESINMGLCPFCEDDIDNLIDDMVDEWRANTYHVVTRNCLTFAEEFVMALRVPEPFPAWVRGAADAGKSPALFAIADYGWSWFKWYSARAAAQELAQEEAARVAEEEKRREEATASDPAEPGSVGAAGVLPWRFGWR